MVYLNASLVVVLSALGVVAVGPSSKQIKNLVTFGDSYTDVVSLYSLSTAGFVCYSN